MKKSWRLAGGEVGVVNGDIYVEVRHPLDAAMQPARNSWFEI